MAEVAELEAPQVDEQPGQQQGGDPVETYYNYLKSAGADVAPSLDSFKKTLSDPTAAQKYYGYLKDNHFDTPDTYDSFAATLGLKKNGSSPSLGNYTPSLPKEASESTSVPTPPIAKIQQGVTTVDQLQKKQQQAKETLHSELTGNNDIIPGIIQKQKSQNQASQNLTDLMGRPLSDQPLTGPQQFANSQLPKEQAPTVSPEEVDAFSQQALADPNAGRGFLAQVAKAKPDKAPAIQEALYVNDAQSRLQNDPNGEQKSGKVMQNAQKIAKGQLVYGVQNGNLQKPEDAWESIGTGIKNKAKAFDDYDFFSNANPQDAAAELEKRRQSFDPDEPIPVPKGMLADMASGMASQPFRGMVVGKLAGGIMAATPGAEELSPAVDKMVTTAVSGDDFRKMSYANSLQQNYNDLRNQGLPPADAYEKANTAAKQESMVDAVSGAAMMAVGSKIGEMKLPNFSLSEGFKNAVITGLKQGAKGIGEAGAVGLIQGAAQQEKNQLAQAKGINTDTTGKDIGDAMTSGALFTLGIAGIAKGMEAMSGITKTKILQGLSKATPEQVDVELGHQVMDTNITPQEAVAAKKAIDEHRELDQSIPDNVTDEARLKIQDKIKRRDYLQTQIESSDPAFHPEIKEKIKAINEDILELAKDKNPRGQQDILSPNPNEDGKKTTDNAQAEGQVNPESAGTNDTVRGAAPSIEPTADLRTWNLGDMEGKPEDEAAKKHIEGIVQQWDAKPATDATEPEKQGETFGEFVQRVIPTFDKILKDEPANSTIVTHSSVLKAFKVWDEMGRPDVKALTDDQKKDFATAYNKEETHNGDLETFKGDNGDIHVIRHGQTEDNAKNNFRSGDTNLTSKGVNDAKEVGNELGRKTGGEVPKIITSDLPRAVHTSNIINDELVGKNVPQNVSRENFKENDNIQSTHFEGEKPVIHVGSDHVVVPHEGGEHIKHEIPFTDIKPKEDATDKPAVSERPPDTASPEPGKEPVTEHAPDASPDKGNEGEGKENGTSEKSDGNLVGPSHGALKKLATKLGLPEIERGTHLTPEEYANRGKELLDGGANVKQVEADFKNGRQPSADDISIARAHLEDLVRQRNEIGDDKNFGTKSPEYDKAKIEVDRWVREVVKPMGTKASEPFTALQGQRDLDTGSFTAIKNAKEEVTGKPQENLPSHIQDLSDRVKSLEDQNKNLEKKLQDAFSGKEMSKPDRQKLSVKLNDLAKRLRTSSEFDDFLKGAQSDIKKMGVDLPKLKEIAASILEDAAKAVKAGENAIDFIRTAVGKLKEDVDKDKLADAIHAIGEKAGLFELKETPEEKNIRRLEKRLEELQQRVFKNNPEKRELSPKEKELQDQIFEEKKKLGLVPSKPLPEKPDSDLTPAEKSIKRKEKELEDLNNGIAKQSGLKRDLTPEEKDLNDQIFEAKKNLGLIKSKSLPKTPHTELSAEEKNIKRLEKQLEDIQTGNGKNQPQKREFSEKEKELKEQISDAKNKAGLLKSRQLSPEETARIKQEQYESLVKRFSDKKDNKFSADDSSDIWAYAKENYIDNNPYFTAIDMINKVSMDFGLTPEQVRNALGRTPEIKKITDQLYKNQYEKNKAAQTIQRWVNQSKDSSVTKLLDIVASPFRGLATLGHGHALMFTHAGMNLFDPQMAKKFFELSAKQFKIVYGKDSLYEKTQNDLRTNKLFTTALRSGVAVDPSTVYDDWQIANNFLKKLKIQGNKGFLILKMMRMAMFENEYNKLSNIEKADPDALSRVGQLVNNWSGTAGLKVSPTSNAFIFAPNLIVSKFARLTTDPIKAIDVLQRTIRGKDVSIEDKVAARIIFRKTGRVMVTYVAALAANQALLSLAGSNASVNFLNPFKSDWLKFKTGDKTIDVSSGMASTMQFLTQLGALPFEDKQDVKTNYRAGSAKDAAGNELTGFIRKILSPFGSTVWDVLSHKDYSGNVLPGYDDQPSKGKEKLTVTDYLEQKLPIPVADAFKTIHDQMKEDGVSELNANYIIGGLILGGIASAGVKVAENQKEKGGGSGGGGGAGSSWKPVEYK